MQAEAKTSDLDNQESVMDLSIVLIAVVFLVPFALAFALLGAMAVDSSWASRPVLSLPRPARASGDARNNRGNDLGHCVPA
jgi:hypothetical protein